MVDSIRPQEMSGVKESFAELLEGSIANCDALEGKVIKGTVVAIEKDIAVIDVGLKSEGRVALREFSEPGQSSEIRVGDVVEVYLERMEDKNGDAVISHEKAKREASWTNLEVAYRNNQRVNGVIYGRVKGGFTVDLSGAIAFLPGSQMDVRPIKDPTPLIGIVQPFQILKMDRLRGNIVVSRRAILEESRAEARTELVSGMEEGQILTGVVKNITEYGAFIDLGGVDGLLHVTDISWRRINHPSEALQIGQSVQVQIIRFNKETQRISLGMKQLVADPWAGADARYPLNSKTKGVVTNITDYGAFIELEAGIEGLVHVSEMSWTKKNVHPNKILSPSQTVEVIVLDVDLNKRRISLGLKQCTDNPWNTFSQNHHVGDEIDGEVRNVTEFGLFVGLPGDIDGMVHLSDLSWEIPGEQALSQYKKGDQIKVKLLDIDVEKERISLGIKQLTVDSFSEAMSDIKKGSVVTCTVSSISEDGIHVTVGDDLPGFIRKNELSRDRSEQRTDRFAVGEKVDAKVTQVDRNSRRLNLSIKARETDEEKEAMAEYGSTDSGARLGDILGAAIKAKKKSLEEAAEATASDEEKPAAKKASKKKAVDAGDEAEITSEAIADEEPKKAKKASKKAEA